MSVFLSRKDVTLFKTYSHGQCPILSRRSEMLLASPSTPAYPPTLLPQPHPHPLLQNLKLTSPDHFLVDAASLKLTFRRFADNSNLQVKKITILENPFCF